MAALRCCSRRRSRSRSSSSSGRRSQAVWYSFQLQDAFGLQTEFVGLRNFIDLFRDPRYLESFKITAVFSVLVASFGIAISLLLATMADRVLHGALAYKTFLIWPYAVASAVAGVICGVPVRAVGRHPHLRA